MADDEQYTDAQLSDGTTLRFKGQLTPQQVKMKVSTYRNSQPTQFEKENTPQTTLTSSGVDEGAQNPVSRTLSAAGGALLGAPAALGSALTHPYTTLKGIGDSIGNAADFYANPKTRPDWEGIKSVLPEALGGGIGNVAAAEAGGRLGAAAVTKGTGLLGDTKAALPISRGDRATQAYQQTIAPTSSKAVEQLDDMETFNRAKPYLSQQAKANPVLATQPSGPLGGQPMGVMNLRQNAQAAAKTLYEKQITPRIDAFSDAPVDSPSVASEIRSTINPDAPPDLAKNAAVEQLAKFYDRPMSVGESMRAIKALNEDKAVQGYEKAFPDKQIEMLRADPALEAKVKAANSLRDKVFDSIEKHGSPEEANYIREARKDYGALKQVAGNLGNANVPTPQSLFSRTLNTAKSLIKPDIGMVDTLFGNPNRLAAKSSKLLGRADLQPRKGPAIRENPWAPPNSSDPLQ